jgi:hypothetical protein
MSLPSWVLFCDSPLPWRSQATQPLWLGPCLTSYHLPASWAPPLISVGSAPSPASGPFLGPLPAMSIPSLQSSSPRKPLFLDPKNGSNAPEGPQPFIHTIYNTEHAVPALWLTVLEATREPGKCLPCASLNPAWHVKSGQHKPISFEVVECLPLNYCGSVSNPLLSPLGCLGGCRDLVSGLTLEHWGLMYN